jgi:hypothetical protein
MTRSMNCPFPPCINPLARPIAALDAGRSALKLVDRAQLLDARDLYSRPHLPALANLCYKFLRIFCPGTPQASFAIQEASHFAFAWTNLTGKDFDITLCERTQPAPSPPEGESKVIRDFISRSLAHENRGSEGTQEGRNWHGLKTAEGLQRVSPCTSSPAQRADKLTRRIVSYSRSPG